ncbi:MAG TPA: M48 family metalloprotease [Candidatus Babeliales bacterium]|nr:M48 family metalloprotease [Candidatus Babeliales bacterium]
MKLIKLRPLIGSKIGLLGWVGLAALNLSAGEATTSSPTAAADRTAASAVAAVKAKWLARANAAVGTEEVNFLAHYGLTPDDVCSDQTVVEDLTSSADAMVAHQWELYQTHRAHEDLTSASDNATLRAVIEPILVGQVCDRVELIHCPIVEDNVGIEKMHTTETCYVTLDKTTHLKDLSRLAAILHHERAHIVYDDNFEGETLRYTVWRQLALQKNLARKKRLKPALPIDVRAWSGSKYQVKAIAQQFQAYQRAYELRADIYAAVHAPELLDSMLKFNADMPDREAITHPRPATRVKTLTAIKTELATAAKLDRLRRT